MKSALRILVLFFFFGHGLAWGALFGAEFTFTNDKVNSDGLKAIGEVNVDSAVEAQRALLREFSRECQRSATCRVEALQNGYGVEVYRVHFSQPPGFWLQISTEPSVVEVQSSPSSIETFEQAKPILNRLFSSAEKTGIAPRDGAGGGHIHMDFASVFKDDPVLFRNFLVDFANNQELGGRGVLGGDIYNAPHFVRLTDEQKGAFLSVIERFDQGQIKSSRKLAEEINRKVYFDNPNHWKPFRKYQALNLARVHLPDGKATVEFRAIEAQRSPDEFLLQIKLLKQRVEFLKKRRGLLQPIGFAPLGELERVAAFRAYVEEAGLNWEDYRGMVRNGSALATSEVTPKSRVVEIPRNGPARSGPMPCARAFAEL